MKGRLGAGVFPQESEGARAGSSPCSSRWTRQYVPNCISSSSCQMGVGH
jgi:hypothetical protein